MNCPFCGYENISGSDICENCGEDLTSFEKSKTDDSLEKSLIRDKLSSIAQCQPVLLDPKQSIQKAAKALNHENSCGLIIQDNALLGVVTVRDILQKAMLKNIDLKTTPISDIMTTHPETLKHSDKIVHALNKMSIGGYRHVPFYLEDGKTLGIVSARDVVAFLAQTFSDVTGIYE